MKSLIIIAALLAACGPTGPGVPDAAPITPDACQVVPDAQLTPDRPPGPEAWLPVPVGKRSVRVVQCDLGGDLGCVPFPDGGR